MPYPFPPMAAGLYVHQTPDADKRTAIRRSGETGLPLRPAFVNRPVASNSTCRFVFAAGLESLN
ncbi:MAG: hypothetical protein ABSE63_07785 [Thermoguttaceae bacterium]|jgi:hypothetical protein